jgi:diguanylate cyclase (GGDEF)-like protein
MSALPLEPPTGSPGAAIARCAEQFVEELDAAVAAHLDWSHRVLRCAALHTPPGDDVLAQDAHRRCRFGRWLSARLETLASVDAAMADHALDQHERMHDAVRTLCTAVLAHGRGDAFAMARFESTQSALLADLADLKTLILGQAARIDALTGLPLRYGLEDEFERARARAHRSHHLLVVMLADIDHFKRVNDDYGHALGDEALRKVAQTLRATARLEEPVFRFGGEEFLLLLHAGNRAAAQAGAERILQALRDTPGPAVQGSALALRLSAGLSEAREGETMAEAVGRADRALYAAKLAGRDRWVWDEGQHRFPVCRG